MNPKSYKNGCPDRTECVFGGQVDCEEDDGGHGGGGGGQHEDGEAESEVGRVLGAVVQAQEVTQKRGRLKKNIYYAFILLATTTTYYYQYVQIVACYIRAGGYVMSGRWRFIFGVGFYDWLGRSEMPFFGGRKNYCSLPRSTVYCVI